MHFVTYTESKDISHFFSPSRKERKQHQADGTVVADVDDHRASYTGRSRGSVRIYTWIDRWRPQLPPPDLLGVAPVGPELGGAGSQHVLVVGGGDGGADQWAHPEDPLVVPGLVLVVDDRGSQAPRRVDAGAGDGDGGQVHHEHGEPNRKRGQHRDVGVTGTALGVGGGEDGVDEHEGADDLGGEAGALGVAVAELVGAAAVAHVVGALEALDEADAADGAQALRDDVEQGADEGHLPRQEQAEGHGRVDVPT
nr:unknown [Zea mays]